MLSGLSGEFIRSSQRVRKELMKKSTEFENYQENYQGNYEGVVQNWR